MQKCEIQKSEVEGKYDDGVHVSSLKKLVVLMNILYFTRIHVFVNIGKKDFIQCFAYRSDLGCIDSSNFALGLLLL